MTTNIVFILFAYINEVNKITKYYDFLLTIISFFLELPGNKNQVEKTQ